MSEIEILAQDDMSEIEILRGAQDDISPISDPSLRSG